MNKSFYYFGHNHFTWTHCHCDIAVYGVKASEDMDTICRVTGDAVYVGHNLGDNTFHYAVTDELLKTLIEEDFGYEMVQWTRANKKLGIKHMDYDVWVNDNKNNE